MLFCRNILDRSLNPLTAQKSDPRDASLWCEYKSRSHYGVFAFSADGEEPKEFWNNGRKYRDARKATMARR